MGRAIRDSDGVRVRSGQTILFNYGLPPVHVRAAVVRRGNRLIALTPGHSPSECPVDEIMEHVGDFWVVKEP